MLLRFKTMEKEWMGWEGFNMCRNGTSGSVERVDHKHLRANPLQEQGLLPLEMEAKHGRVS